MSGKVIPFPGNHLLPHGGTFSNIVDKKPLDAEDMMRALRDSIARIKRLDMRLVERDDRLILPPDWETTFHPSLVAEIKRRLGQG